MSDGQPTFPTRNSSAGEVSRAAEILAFNPERPVCHFNPSDPSLTADRVFEVYDELRRSCPVAYSDQLGGFWMLSRYKDVYAASRDHTTYRSGAGTRIILQDGYRPLPLESDPPLHTAYRNLLIDSFSQRSVLRLEPHIRETVNDLFEALVNLGEGDLVTMVATPLTVRVACSTLGLPAAAWAAVRSLEQELRRGNAAPLREYLMAEAELKRSQPRDDLITKLVHSTIDGRPISNAELESILMSVVLAGHETTLNTAGMAALYLVEDLDLQDKLRRDPSLIPQYIEEVLRYRAPSHMRARTLAADAVVDGKTLRKGERVVFLSAAANRDPEQFEEPTKFSLERPDSRHLSFGAGIHGCLGSRLARAELRIFLEELLKRPRLLLNGEAKHTPLIAAMHMGVMALPVRFLDPGDL